MYLRLDKDLAARLHSASDRYGLKLAEIVRRALRWAKRCGYVVKCDKRRVTTYKGEMLKLTDLTPDLAPKRGLRSTHIRAAVRAYLDAHDHCRGLADPQLEADLVEGRDYNVPAGEVLRRFLKR